jgi:hypothetical protein
MLETLAQSETAKRALILQGEGSVLSYKKAMKGSAKSACYRDA